MASDFDRDESIDRLLKGASRSRPEAGAGADGCLDAETLAAWAEGAVAPDHARLIESHLAGCARCQTMAAAFARTADVPAAAPPTVVAFERRRFALKWLVPLAAGTAAATLFIWTAVRDRGAFEPELAVSRVEPPAATAPDIAPPPQAQTGAVPPPAEAAGALAKSATPQRTPSPTGADARSRIVQSRPQDRVQTAQPAARLAQTPTQTPAVPTPAAAPPPTPPAKPSVTPVPTPMSTPLGRTMTQTTVTAAGQQVAAAADLRARNEAVFLSGVSTVVSEFSWLASATETVAPAATRGAGGRGGAGRGGGGGGVAGGIAARVAAEPTPSLIRWRILASGVIERSTDNGTTWTAATIEPPPAGVSGFAIAPTTAPTLPTSGSATSPSICWVVGRRGIVLLSTDGLHFARVTSPTLKDLASVAATDAARATVTTVDGETFTTIDGGKTWRQI